MQIDHPFQDPSLAIDQRVDDLLSRLTHADRIGIMYHSQISLDPPTERDRYGRESAAEMIRNRRMNHFCVQGAPSSGRELAAWSNAVQRLAAAEPLGIPVTISTDPRHSITDNLLSSNDSGAISQWPEPIGIAAIGSADTARLFGDITRREYIAGGIRLALGPQIDLTTEPRWARIPQTFGEDAELTSVLVAAYLLGLQGESLGPDSVAAMTKHFPGGGPQKDGLDPHFQDGREQVYPGGRFDEHLRPFIAALRAGTSQIMPYYGMPVGTEYEEVGFAFNAGIITGLLREQLGFEGIVCTDFGLITGYGEALPAKAWGVENLSRLERTVRLIEAGIDQIGGETSVELLSEAVTSGAVSPERIDVSVRRLLREKFVLGLFDEQRYVDEEHAQLEIGSADNRAAGIQAQKASLTLLTNGPEDAPTLPLRRGVRVYSEGIDVAAFDGFAEAVASPAGADVAVLRVTAPSSADPARGFLGSMHKGDLDFPVDVVTHIREIADTVPTVLDVFLDRPAILTPVVDAVAALVGSYGTSDSAFVATLFGDGEPRGRLPFDLPSSMEAVRQSRTDVPFDTAAPLFRFGHGLAYVSSQTASDV